MKGRLDHLLLTLVLTLLSSIPAFAASATKPPNILFLFADDQRADTIHALGNRHIQTPNLDRLARSGTAFARAYIMGSMHGAVCVPSRAMLMTGRTLFRATASPTNNIISAKTPMWPELFRKQGYRTIGIGKWHNDRASYARAFSEGGPIFFGGMTDQSKVRVFDYDPGGAYHRQRIARTFSTKLFADAAIDFLRNPSDKPFVLYVAFTVPHDPRTPPPSFSRQYRPKKMPLPENFMPRHPFDNGEMTVRDELLLPTPREPRAVQSELAAYYGLISHMDQQIGRILEALEQTAQASNTIIVFAADNGLALGSHGLLGKQNLYEHSVRVPLIISGPAIAKDKISEAFCYLHDLAPTLCDLAGVPKPPTFEGHSLVPILRGEKKELRDSIFCAYRDVQRSVRDQGWKLIWYPRLDRYQLFDLRSDPHEASDLSSDHSHDRRIRELRKLMESWQRNVSDPLLEMNQPLDESPLRATLTIDPARVEGKISPLLYGQFIEYMYEGIKGGLHAELLRNRSFEEPPNSIGLSRHWERYPDDRNDDYGLNFRWDNTVFYPPESKGKEHSLRIDLTNGVVQRHGLFQSRIPVREGVPYSASLWLKAQEFNGRVRVALEADRTAGDVYAESNSAERSADWKQYNFKLVPRKSDPLARFAILFDGVGRVWLDLPSVMPLDATNGIRADIFEKISMLKPSFIRWPGGNVAQDYHWQWGVGPRDRRFTWKNLSWKNEPEPSDFGTDEFVAFCRRLKAEPSITVNVEGRGATAGEAAAWVDYCNGAADTKFGSLRAANGHPAPFAVKFWEIGNEIWGPWVRGHTDARTYARRYRRYVDAMRKIDPAIKCIAVGDNNPQWNQTVLDIAGDKIDLLAIHHYYTARETAGDPRNLMARPLHYERFYGDIRAQLANSPKTSHIKLAINEWGLDLPESRQYSIESALYSARLMNVFERNSDLIEMTAVSDLVNGWPGGIIQASSHDVFVTPIYLANQLYAQNLGAERLHVDVISPTFSTTLEGKNVPYLDATASRSAAGDRVFVKMVNTHPKNPMQARLELPSAIKIESARQQTLVAPSLNAVNGFKTPDAISIRENPVSVQSPLLFELPRHSVSVLTLVLEGR